jgi:hypothetical protein
MSRWPQLFGRDAPFSERILEFIGVAVIVLGVPAFFFALFEIGTVFGVLGIVLIVGALGAGLIALLRRPSTRGERRAAADERGAANGAGPHTAPPPAVTPYEDW